VKYLVRFFEIIWTFLQHLLSPKWFYSFTERLLPWIGLLTTVFLITGVGWGLLWAPSDYQQGNSYRIIFIHVPAASLALACYLALALIAGIGYIWKIKLAAIASKCLAPIGASFCLMALITGAIWGKPTWGTWWVWDARLTSMLILLFLYMGLIVLRAAIEDKTLGSNACAILALVGLVNLPVIKYSVNWWNTLHQGASINLISKSTMAPEMLTPLLISIVGFYAFCFYVFLLRMRTEIITSESKAHWVRNIIQTHS